jgi:iron complex transport system permease protein
MQIDVTEWRLVQRQRHRNRFYWLAALLTFSLLLSLTHGAMHINVFETLTQLEHRIITEIRAPRALMTLTTGAGLAICGLILVISAAVSLFFVPLMAFVGAIIALALLLTIAGYRQPINTLVLILTGVAINAGAATLLGLITFIADDNTLRLITFWQLGSYSGIDWPKSVLATLIVSAVLMVFWRNSNSIMLLQIGEQHARFQGVNVDKLKRVLLISVAFVTAISVCFTGIVGFVGLVVPHICRMLVGTQLRALLPTTAIFGAVLVTLADVAARVVIVPAELPIGLLTSALGVPFFLWLILREKRKFSHD